MFLAEGSSIEVMVFGTQGSSALLLLLLLLTALLCSARDLSYSFTHSLTNTHTNTHTNPHTDIDPLYLFLNIRKPKKKQGTKCKVGWI